MKKINKGKRRDKKTQRTTPVSTQKEIATPPETDYRDGNWHSRYPDAHGWRWSSTKDYDR